MSKLAFDIKGLQRRININNFDEMDQVINLLIKQWNKLLHQKYIYQLKGINKLTNDFKFIIKK